MRINDIQISENFKLYEFECKDGSHLVKVCPILLAKLQTLRKRLGKPIIIGSGYRTPEYNRKVGGEDKTSQHLFGKAADIKVSGFTPKQVAAEAEKVGFGGIGIYSTFVHLDTRSGKARWNG